MKVLLISLKKNILFLLDLIIIYILIISQKKIIQKIILLLNLFQSNFYDKILKNIIHHKLIFFQSILLIIHILILYHVQIFSE